MKQWKTLSSEIIHETPWIKLYRDKVYTHSDQLLTYTFVELQHLPGVRIIAINNKKEIYLNKNYRYTVKAAVWELPAGHSDGEDPLIAARRELVEEARLESNEWARLGQHYEAVGVANIPMAIYIASNAQSAAEQPLEEIEEVIEGRFFTWAEIEEMIKNGTIVNGADIGALYMAKLHGL